MASTYPVNYDAFSTKVDGVTEILAKDVNDVQSSVTAIEYTLGLDPAGTKSTVVERLNVSLNPDGTLIAGIAGTATLDPGILGTGYIIGSDLTLKQVSYQIQQASGSFSGNISLRNRLDVALASTGQVNTAIPMISTVATGTSPLTIASTTKVGNLNADLVDGVEVASLTNARLLRYNSTDNQIESSAIIESAGALSGITSLSTSTLNVSSTVNLSGLTASRVVITDGSKNLSTVAYTNLNTANNIVRRDASGNFSAGTITATLSGNASSATTAGTCTGNSATVTNGVYTTGNQTISGTKTFLSTIYGSINGPVAPTRFGAGGTTWLSQTVNNLDVSQITVIFCYSASGDKYINGLSGGAPGQILFVVGLDVAPGRSFLPVNTGTQPIRGGRWIDNSNKVQIWVCTGSWWAADY
jgi:hypothetical protein